MKKLFTFIFTMICIEHKIMKLGRGIPHYRIPVCVCVCVLCNATDYVK